MTLRGDVVRSVTLIPREMDVPGAPPPFCVLSLAASAVSDALTVIMTVLGAAVHVGAKFVIACAFCIQRVVCALAGAFRTAFVGV